VIDISILDEAIKEIKRDYEFYNKDMIKRVIEHKWRLDASCFYKNCFKNVQKFCKKLFTFPKNML